MMWGRNIGLLVVPVLLSSCATVNLNAGFSEVSTLVEERGKARIVWNSGTDLDKEAAEMVRTLLRGKLAAGNAVQVALLNNRGLQAIYSELGVAQADLVQAGLLKNPIFDAAVKFPTSGSQANLELTAVMSFLDILYMPLRKRVAGARFEEAKLRVTGLVLDFAGQVRSAFYLHQANEQMVELRRTIVEALDVSLQAARRLHEAGNITDLDLARERALAEESRLALRAAEIGARQSRERLNTLMGLWGKDTEWQADGRLPEIPEPPKQLEGIEGLALNRSIDLANARQRIVVAGEQLGLNQTTALVPELHAGALGERDEGSWEVGPVFEFPIPLFDQGQARIGRALAELRRAQQEYYEMAVRIRATARAVEERMQGTQDRALYYRDIIIPLQERIVNEVQLQYNAMQLGVFQLLRARERQITTSVNYVEALRDYWLARGDLEQLLNGRLPSPNGAAIRAGAQQIQMDQANAH